MAFLPAVALTVGIAVLSLTESTAMPSVSLDDKVVHALVYALLAVTWILPLSFHFSPFTFHLNLHFGLIFEPAPYLLVLLGITAYGALLELLQHYCTLTRSGEWLDLLADFLGALVGVTIVAIVNRKW